MTGLPPLTKVFRPGAGRQRLAKGYVVAGRGAADWVAQLLTPGSRILERATHLGLTLRGNAQAPCALWLDTGLIWLHYRDCREKLASQLFELLRELKMAVEAMGGALLPSAARLDDVSPWDQLVCADEHFIETSSEREKTTFCNLLRFHLPELVALTGRAGASPAGVEQLGSRRLADSRRHVPARAFASLSPEYLPHLVKSLSRRERVPRLSLLDIDPHEGDGPGGACNEDGCVELRFVDAQAHFRTSLSHALLFEALLIRARRIAAEDREVPEYPQPRFERDRARAIQHGLHALFAPRSPAELADYPHDSLSEDELDDTSAGLVPAPLRWLELLDDLSYEFQALDARYRDLAPLVSGVTLRQWGELSVQNENDLLRSWPPEQSIEQRLRSVLVARGEPFKEANQGHDSARDIEADWKERLKEVSDTSSDHATVWLTLDLRQSKPMGTEASDYQSFWTHNAGQLFGKRLEPNQSFVPRDTDIGDFTLQVARVPNQFREVTSATPFAIHSVLEPPQIRRVCRCCQAERLDLRQAPLICDTCAELQRKVGPAAQPLPRNASPQLCAVHAVILEGKLRPFCPAHVPVCHCQQAAWGFCAGEACKPQSRAFCQSHLHRHPSGADVHYCQACYERLFPACLAPGCTSLATIRCSHWDADTQRACAKTYCAEHALSWQVYGRHNRGLGRCDEHADLSQLDDPSLIFQLTASALVEQRIPTHPKFDNRLPSLQAIAHVLMKPRQVRYDLAQVDRLFEQLREQLDAARPFEKNMLALLDKHAAFRRDNLEQDARNKAIGRPIFDALVAELERQDFHALATRLGFADFQRKNACLYVRLERDWRGHLIGAGHERIHQLSDAIGARIRFERGPA